MKQGKVKTTMGKVEEVGDFNDPPPPTSLDFSNLKGECLKNQLAAIFGNAEAEQFLHPTIQDKRVKSVPVNFSSKSGGPVGAEELWQSLRFHSKQKILQNTSSKYTYTRKNTGNASNVESNVLSYKQKLQMMYKIAHLNDSKSQKLIQKINFPEITVDWDFITNFDEESVKGKGHLVLPNINNTKNESASRNIHEKCSRSNETIILNDQPKIISFLSEKDLKFPSKFRERMKDKGVAASVGISNASHIYNKLCKNTNQVDSTLEFRDRDVRVEDSRNDKSRIEKPSSKPQDISQPFTLSTIINGLDAYTSSRKVVHVMSR